LMRYTPNLESVSVVPVGLSKYREGLYPLEPFTKEDAKEVLTLIHKYQQECMEQYGTHFVHASDEWYILAEEELPEEARYDGYLQLENGVGMLRLLMEEFGQAMEERKGQEGFPNTRITKEISMATGLLAYPYIVKMVNAVCEAYPNIKVHVYPITNHFFGEKITVSGLLTGQDIRDQLMGKVLGEVLLLPQNVLRSGERVFLDDLTVEDLERALQVPVNIVKSSGCDFVDSIVN